MHTISRRALLLAAGAVWAGSALSHRALASLRSRASALETFFPWQTIRERAHVSIDATLGGNVLVVRGADGAVLVDTKFPSFSGTLRREAGAHGAPLAMVINTHHHADHSGGNLAFHPDIDLLAHPKAKERIGSQLDRYRSLAEGGWRQIDSARAGAAKVIDEAHAVADRAQALTPDAFTPTLTPEAFPHEAAVAGERVELHHAGAGHTDNDLIVRFPELNLIHTGDLVFHTLHPYFDPPGGSNSEGWVRSLEAARALCDNDTIVVPGHGPLTDATGIDRQRDYLLRLREAVAEGLRAGATKEELQARTWPFMEGLGFEQVRSRAIGAVCDELAAPTGG